MEIDIQLQGIKIALWNFFFVSGATEVRFILNVFTFKYVLIFELLICQGYVNGKTIYFG